MLARRAAFGPVTVTRYGRTATIHAAAITCLWYGVFGPRRVKVLLIRDVSATGCSMLSNEMFLRIHAGQALRRPHNYAALCVAVANY